MNPTVFLCHNCVHLVVVCKVFFFFNCGVKHCGVLENPTQVCLVCLYYRKEFDIVPVTVNHNKSPVIHVEHYLGLESWCVRHVYCYTYHRLMDARQLRTRREG